MHRHNVRDLAEQVGTDKKKKNVVQPNISD